MPPPSAPRAPEHATSPPLPYRALADMFRLGVPLSTHERVRLHQLAQAHGNYLLAGRTA
jgi:hypothetical protein